MTSLETAQSQTLSMAEQGHPTLELHGTPAPDLLQQPFETVISRFLAATILSQDWRFFVNDQPITADVLCSNKMMLPAILWQADKTHQLLCGKPLGVQFCSNPDAAFGAHAVVTAPPGASRAMYPVFCLEVLIQSLENFTLEGPDTVVPSIEVRENILLGGRVPPRSTSASMDHLIQGFNQDHENGMVSWTTDSNPRAPNYGNGAN